MKLENTRVLCHFEGYYGVFSINIEQNIIFLIPNKEQGQFNFQNTENTPKSILIYKQETMVPRTQNKTIFTFRALNKDTALTPHTQNLAKKAETVSWRSLLFLFLSAS